MRLLYLSADPGVPVFGGKGASVHVRAMVGAFVELGHEVIVASPRLEPGDEELPGGVRCVAIPAVRPRSAGAPEQVSAEVEAQAEAVRRLAVQARIEGIYERYSLSSCAGARTSRATGTPLIVEVNAPLREEERRFRQLAHESVAVGAEAETFETAELIVAVSEPLRDWLESLGVQAARIGVIPNPAAHEGRGDEPPPGRREELRVGFAGSLKPWHGIRTLLSAAEATLSHGARVRFELVGEGPEAALVEQAAARLPGLTALGHLPHRESLRRMRSWDIGVAPYTSIESFYFSPLKLGEYMAAGLCPVVSDVGSLAAIVEDGRAGIVIPPDDPQALCQALLGLDADRDRLARLADRARTLATRRPTWLEVAERLGRVFSASSPRDPAHLEPVIG
jgi:starch synthase